MPIGFLIGISLAFTYMGFMLMYMNRQQEDYKYVQWSQAVRQSFRVIGMILFYTGLFSLIGTIIELIVR